MRRIDAVLTSRSRRTCTQCCSRSLDAHSFPSGHANTSTRRGMGPAPSAQTEPFCRNVDPESDRDGVSEECGAFQEPGQVYLRRVGDMVPSCHPENGRMHVVLSHLESRTRTVRNSLGLARATAYYSKRVVPPAALEPATSRLEGGRVNMFASARPMFRVVAGSCSLFGPCLDTLGAADTFPQEQPPCSTRLPARDVAAAVEPTATGALAIGA